MLQEYNALKQRFDEEYHRMAERKREFQQELDALGRLNMKIKEYSISFHLFNSPTLLLICNPKYTLRYLDSKRMEMLNELQERYALKQSELQNCEAKKQGISDELNKSKELLQGQGQLKRNIDDNLSYRKTKAEVNRLTRDIELLEERVLSIGSSSTIEADLKRHSQEREMLNSEVLSIHSNSYDSCL